MRQKFLTSLLHAVTVLVLLLAAHPAQAQYFGRNKVQWENFNFKILHTQHFDIFYYDREKDVVDDVGRQAERWYDRLSHVFNHEFTRKPIVLYANSADFQQTTTTSGLIGEGTGGFTDPIQNRVVLPLTGDYAENDHVLGHEMVHVFQFDIANRASSGSGAMRRRFDIESMPLWLIEGMAEYFSKGRIDPLTAMWIRDASARDKMPDLRRLTRDPRYFPYRYGEALMAYIGGRFGDDSVISYFLAAGQVGPDQAFERALGVKSKELFNDWHASAKELYAPLLTAPHTGQKALLSRDTTRGHLNIGPSLSPDGRLVAFLSTRELFSIDLFIADAQTGRIVRKLVSSEGDPHFDALRFIDSAGSWSPDSKKLAFVVFEHGDNRIAVVDADSGRVDRITVPHIDALSNPVWSPDGHTLAFSGQSTGVTDLYLYDLNTKEVRQLTNDKYADLQPAFSPDGGTIAFATDRGAGTDLERLRYDDLRIATIDVATGRLSVLPLFQSGKHINPQYAPDGRSIYFISDPDGVSNVYRYSFDGGALSRITNVTTGVSGITDLSPALSVAARSGDLAYSVYESDDHSIYTLPASTRGEPVSASFGNAVPLAALLPPKQAAASSTSYTTYLQRPEEGLLPTSTTFNETPYDPRLHLTYIGPPTIGVGADRYGFGIGGSLSAYFSDVLGHHNLGFTFQGGGTSGGGSSLSDSLGGELQYLNQTHRINWGGTATHIPYVSAVTASGQEIVTIGGQDYLADVVQQRRDVQTFDDISGLAQYPLSLTRRFEVDGGYQRIGFKSELREQIIVGDQIVSDQTVKLGDSIAINLFRGAAAFVGDSSQFGFIDPIRGTRYRFQIEALTGDLHFETALADYRKYFFMRPFTFAVRGLHYGRYGKDAEDGRLSPIYLGQETLVRGYSIDSFDLSECANPDPNACPAFDRLVGSKIGVGTAELRVPLFGTKEFGLIPASAIPTELVGFVDAGVAWTEAQSPKLRFEQNSTTTDRIPVVSAGVAARVLLSYIPLEFYYAHPFQRPAKDWVFGFSISAGW